MNTADACSLPGCPEPPEWHFRDIRLCQHHWEEYCDTTWWQYHLREKESTIEEFVASRGRTGEEFRWQSDSGPARKPA